MELKKIYDRDIIIRSICEHYGITQEQLKRNGVWNSRKPEAYYLLSRDGGLKNIQISEIFSGIHPSVVGRQINVIVEMQGRDDRLMKTLWDIRGKYGYIKPKKQ